MFKGTIKTIALLGLAFTLCSCAVGQDFIDGLDRELYGIVPDGKTLQTWTIRDFDISLERAHISREFRLTSPNLKKPIPLSLSTVDKVERFEMFSHTVLVFQGRYGAENRRGAQILNFGKKLKKTLLPLKDEYFVFRRSFNNEYLIGSPKTIRPDTHYFIVTEKDDHWPVPSTELRHEDGDYYWERMQTGTPVTSTHAQSTTTFGDGSGNEDVQVLSAAPTPDLPDQPASKRQAETQEVKILKLD